MPTEEVETVGEAATGAAQKNGKRTRHCLGVGRATYTVTSGDDSVVGRALRRNKTQVVDLRAGARRRKNVIRNVIGGA